MYSFICGTIEEKQENLVVINNNGIGYEIYISTLSLNKLPQVGEDAKVYTYLYVREDIMQIFGFANKQEKDVFLSLLSVSGIGAKTAIQILSYISAPELVNAIIFGDVKLIASIKGIGKKTAERILLELKNSVNQLNGITLENYSEIPNTLEDETSMSEAVGVLVNMGLTKMDATKIVNKVAEPNDTTEVIVTKALRNMG